MARIPFSFSGTYKTHHFRSLKELSFMLRLDRDGLKWESAERKEYSVTWTDRFGHTKYHWSDFVVEGHIIVEVKPRKLWKRKIVQLKAEAMKKWCQEHGYEYQMVAPYKVPKEELRRLVENGIVIIDDHLREKFKKYVK